MKRNRLSRRYWISFFTVVSVSIALIVAIVFSLYSTMQISAAQQYSIGQLEQVCRMTDILCEEMRYISNQILQNASTNACLSGTSFDRLKEVSACIKLREIQSSNPYTRYVSFYNSATNRFVSSSTVDFLTEADIDYYYSLIDENSGDACTLRLIGPNYVTQPQKTKYVYSFVFQLRLRADSKTPDLIVIDVDEDYFSSAIENLRVEGGFQQILIANRNGAAFSINGAEDTDSAFSHMNELSLDLAALPPLEGVSGALSCKLTDGTSALVTYAKTQSLGFTVFNIVPYASIFSELPKIALLTLFAGLFVLGLAAVLSVRFSLRLSAPIEVLYRNYVKTPSTDKAAGNELDQLSRAFSAMYAKTDKLEQGLIASYSDSRKHAVQQLMHGEYRQISDYRAFYTRFDIDLSAPFYTIIAMKSVPQSTETAPSESASFISNYALENVATEVTGLFGKIVTYRNSKDMLCVLLALSENAHPKRLEMELGRVIDVMHREFNLETTVCIGNIVETFENINLCYEATTIALEYSALRAHGQVFFAGAASEQLNLSQYHNKLHIKLAEHIRNEDLDACSQEFDLALSYMTNVSFATAITYFNHVMMSLLDDFSAVFTDDSAYALLMAKLNQIDRNLQNVYTLRIRCMEFLTMLAHHLSISRNRGNERATDAARAYIDKNYANPDLSLRMLADMVGLSPAYFGKVFTAQTTYTFNDYLMHTRLQKAAQLLVETKLPVNQISESVGMLNANYFYSVFKKKYGMTPLAYRRECARSNRTNDPPPKIE